MATAVLAGPARTEAVAVLVNMAIAALPGASERRAQDPGCAPGTGSAGLPAAVVNGAGPRAHRVHDAPVRPGGGGRPAGLGPPGRGGDRHRPGDLRPVGRGPGRVR